MKETAARLGQVFPIFFSLYEARVFGLLVHFCVPCIQKRAWHSIANQ